MIQYCNITMLVDSLRCTDYEHTVCTKPVGGVFMELRTMKNFFVTNMVYTYLIITREYITVQLTSTVQKQ